MHTTAFWLHFPRTFLDQAPEFTASEQQAGLIGMGNAMRTVAALLLMSDPRDVGTAITEDIAASLEVWEPDLFLYDNFAGGAGLSAPLYGMGDKLIQHTRELIQACRCEEGCPSCVGPQGELGERGKPAALRMLELLTAPVTSPQL
jgi:DEAD/DEAH box helicase domain-containing protein